MRETTSHQLLRWPELRKMLGGISRSTIDRWENSNKFPRRIHLGKNIIGWNLNLVTKWLEEKQK